MHFRHRGSKSRPQVNYKFGSGSKPFYDDLRWKCGQNKSPWQWLIMKEKYSNAKTLIEDLVNEAKYEFTLNGKFEDVIGTNAAIHFGPSESIQGKRDPAVTAPQADDPDKPIKFQTQPKIPAPVNPEPPVVRISIPDERNMPDIKGKIVGRNYQS